MVRGDLIKPDHHPVAVIDYLDVQFAVQSLYRLNDRSYAGRAQSNESMLRFFLIERVGEPTRNDSAQASHELRKKKFILDAHVCDYILTNEMK